jgi:hypothetical protein
MAEEQKPIPLREHRPEPSAPAITSPMTTEISMSRLEDSQISISPMFIAAWVALFSSSPKNHYQDYHEENYQHR